MGTVPYSPLTDDELRRRYQSEAMFCAGALEAWDRFGGTDRPDAAIRHAREAVVLVDAAVAR